MTSMVVALSISISFWIAKYNDKSEKGFSLKSAVLTQRNILYLNILLSIVLILASLLLIRDVISHYFEKQKAIKRDTSASAAAVTPLRKMQLADYASILKNNPFGFSAGEIKPLTVSTGSSMPQNLVLIGTVVGPKELSYGVFKDNSGMQEAFKVGESVFGLGKL